MYLRASCDANFGSKDRDLTHIVQTIQPVILEWKRALKNYKNIVTIFVDEESSFKAEANRWMGPGARKSHKSAKMFYINCAEKEGKKLCKKYKQNPKPTTMQYWREGLFYKEFHREETPKAGFTPTRGCPQHFH